MKKIGKIFINPEKVINNDELVSLRGGYGLDPMPCLICYSSQQGGIVGILWNPPYAACHGDYNLALDACHAAYGPYINEAWCDTCEP